MKCQSPDRTNLCSRVKIYPLHILLICVSFLLWKSPSALAAEKIIFKFNPPHGTTFVETLEYTQTLEGDPLGKVSTLNTSKTRYTIRKTPGGYYVDASPIKPARLKKSDRTMSAINSMISELQMTYELNENGQLLRMRGGEKAIRKLKKVMPPGMIDTILSAIYGQPITIEQFIADQWIRKELTGFMVGETMELNQFYQANLTLPFYGGREYKVMIRTIARRFSDCGELAPFCIYLRAAMKSTDSPLLDHMADIMRKLLIDTFKMFAANEPSVDANKLERAISEIPHFKFTRPEITALYERVMDVETGLTREMSIKQRIRANFSINSGEASAFVLSHDTYAAYDYD